MQEFHCTVYSDGKILIPSKIRELLSISPHDKIILKVTDSNEVILDTVQHELSLIQLDIKDFFKNKSIVNEK